jgi:plasmid maintenance system killer protein
VPPNAVLPASRHAEEAQRLAGAQAESRASRRIQVIEAPEVEAPAHLTGGGDNLLLELVWSGDRGVAEKELLRVTNPETISELIGKGAAVRVGDRGITMIRYVPQEKHLRSMDSSVEEWLAKNPAAQWKIDDLLKAAQAQHDDHAYLALKRPGAVA